MNVRKAVVITGAGVVSSIGNSQDEIWSTLSSHEKTQANIDSRTYRPFVAHTEVSFDPSTHIEQKQQIRSMGKAQLMAAHAAGQALKQASLLGNSDALSRMEIHVAACTGDADREVDEPLLKAASSGAVASEALNAALMSNRPSLYLTQLPNLFAASVCSCYGITGNSVTYIGEHQAGAAALNVAFSKIRAGQADMVLVGGVAEGVTWANMQLEAFARGIDMPSPNVDTGEARSPTQFGNAAAFLVLESGDHARSRGAKPLCTLRDVKVSAESSMAAVSQTVQDTAGASQEEIYALFSSQGAAEKTKHENGAGNAKWLLKNTLPLTGDIGEASFPFSLAFATMCLMSKMRLPSVLQDATDHSSTSSKRRVLAGYSNSDGHAVADLEHDSNEY